MRVKIKDVKISKRVRKEVGDLESLKKSLTRHGLLHPILINTNGELISGYRRLCAATELGWSEIEAVEISPNSTVEQLEIEMEENMVRKDFTQEEMIDGMNKKKKLLTPNIFVRIWNWIKRLFGIR